MITKKFSDMKPTVIELYIFNEETQNEILNNLGKVYYDDNSGLWLIGGLYDKDFSSEEEANQYLLNN